VTGQKFDPLCLKPIAPYSSQMSPENAHKLIRIYIGGLILGINTLYMLSCFLKQFALVGKGLTLNLTVMCTDTHLHWNWLHSYAT